MKDIKKYQGVIPAFYACYDAEGNISTEGVKALTRHLIAKGVKGVYVGGSSGECIYQHVDERKAVLEAVMSEAKGKLTVIAHVGCNNTADSVELARHAESVGVDAIASIPPIYFHLPEYAIAKYWNDMSAAAPNTEFVIYNIPQLAGTGLTMSLLKEMLKNPNVVAVKNSSMPTQDIQMFKDAGIAARGEGNFVVFNGPDEQFVSGRVMGADGGIGDLAGDGNGIDLDIIAFARQVAGVIVDIDVPHLRRDAIQHVMAFRRARMFKAAGRVEDDRLAAIDHQRRMRAFALGDADDGQERDRGRLVRDIGRAAHRVGVAGCCRAAERLPGHPGVPASSGQLTRS